MTLTFETSSGTKKVANWGYRLQGHAGAPLDINELAKAPHDLLVIDFSRDGSGTGALNASEISKLKSRPGRQSVVVSYISISEASDYRDHWQDDWTKYNDADQRAAGASTRAAPGWLGAWNEKWPNSRKVRYWDPEWQTIVFKWLDAILAAGFDGAYLDIIDGYYHWGVEAAKSKDRRPDDPANERDAAARMIDFVAAISARARKANPRFLIIPQNGAFIIDALEDEDHPCRDAYLGAINALACEDLFFRGDSPENNHYAPDDEAISAIERDFHEQDKPILSVDYVSDAAKRSRYITAAVTNGFLPYAAPVRDLSEMAPPYGGTAEAVV